MDWFSLLALAISATGVVLVAKAIAVAIAGRGASRSELAQIRERLEQLEEAQTSVANQSIQLAELQERLDFAERLLAQARDRSALGPGEKGA